MARLNNRPSSLGQPRLSTETSSRSSSPNNASDVENRDPDASRRSKGKDHVMPQSPSSSFPTPNSDHAGDSARRNKRKRDDLNEIREEDEGPREHVQEGENMDGSTFSKYYDPNQDAVVRRQIKRQSRVLEREFFDNRDDLLGDSGQGLRQTIDRANTLFKDIRQTSDATVDARLLVRVSELGKKKAAQLMLGDTSTGLDIDEFLSKCISYMRNGSPSGATHSTNEAPSRRRRTATQAISRDDASDDEDEDGADPVGKALDWERFGRRICFPIIKRPCVPSFLLGPLSVEKKVRAQTQRRGRRAKDNAAIRESRPEAVTAADISTSDQNALTAVCTRIRNQFGRHVTEAHRVLENAGFADLDELRDARGRSFLRKCGLADTGGVPLFQFVINPRSFGQTIENLFYVSFLIKEGSLGVKMDGLGLPSLMPGDEMALEKEDERNLDENLATTGNGDQARRGKNKNDKSDRHQAVFALDYGTWQRLIAALEIQSSMIPHRDEEEGLTQVGSRGWYT